MANDKIYKKLPEVLQTTGIKNFFEATVEQLFAEANTETVKGLIGTQASDDYNVDGAFIRELDANRHHYSVTPVVNTISSTDSNSENFVFFDEFIDVLKTYSVDITNQNRLFGGSHQAFLPPIDADKLINYQEYYWVTDGPSTIQVTGTLAEPINIDQDAIGQVSFTPPGGLAFRNGMIVKFTGGFVIPESKAEIDYVVQGVGEEITLVPKIQNFSTQFSTPILNTWDATPFSVIDAHVVHTAGNVISVAVDDPGLGYVTPTVSFIGANTTVATATANANAAGSITDVTVTDSGFEYGVPVGIELSDIDITHTILVKNTVVDGDGTPVTNTIVSVSVLVLDSVSNVIVGQEITHANFTGVVTNINGTNVTLSSSVSLDDSINTSVSFAGVDFVGTVRTDWATFVTYGNGVVRTTSLASSAHAGQDPNTGAFYLQGGEFSWDKDIDGDGTADLSWGGTSTQATPDYLVIERGAANKNVWSRVNFWYHRENFLDAGDELPDQDVRANRPIIEFDRYIEMYNSGNVSVGTVNLASTASSKDDVNGSLASTLVDNSALPPGATIIFPNDTNDTAQYVYKVALDSITNNIDLKRVGGATNPDAVEDGEAGFVPFVFTPGDQIQVTSGATGIGQEYFWDATVGLELTQFKGSVNQAPLFNLYDDTKKGLNDTVLFPDTDFVGNKIFGFAENETGTDDTVYGFPLLYKSFKSSSEIAYANFIDTERTNYQVFGDTSTTEVPGYYYYKRLTDDPEYFSCWKTSSSTNEQRIKTYYYVNRFDVASSRIRFYIGCLPNVDTSNLSGYDIMVSVNGVNRTDFALVNNSFIDFTAFNLGLGDVVEIGAKSATGLIADNTISKYELPLSWFANVNNEDIDTISEPEFLPHFKNYMESQVGFEGDPLSSNNFSSATKDIKFATDIVKTDQDLILAAFLMDDQPHNIIDSIRFNASEYEKYKNRLKMEITNYFDTNDTTSFTNEFVLERVLRNLISFSVGKEVFNRTYIVPFGDNFVQEDLIVVDDEISSYTLTAYEDLDKVENSLLVYLERAGVQTLLSIDNDYTIDVFNPITLEFSYTLQEGDIIITKLYNDQRDSAQCPPTPSTMGMFPLYQPAIVSDASFQTPVDVIVGHDGSRTSLFGDERDNILLEFEKRIYNAAKAEFRLANSIPELSLFDVRAGAFRTTNFESREWADLLRTSFSNWTVQNKVDHITNENYDETNEFTWNYRGTGVLPGHWRGWYLYYYDTVCPHEAPWEMLGFFEQPSWWTTSYGTDYSSTNITMWSDLEQGIIRDGVRENFTGGLYLTNNPHRRLGLSKVLPVDSNAELLAPYNITNTGSTTRTASWTNVDANVSAGYVTTSFLNMDGVDVSFDSSNVYINGEALVNHTPPSADDANISQQAITFNVPRINLTSVTSNATVMPGSAVGVLTNGLPLFNPNQADSWNDEDVWHYNNFLEDTTVAPGFNTTTGLYFYHAPLAEAAGLTEWDTANHSPIVGWAFDGLPIYGPYGYSDYFANGAISDSTITNIKSSFELKDDTRLTGPGGAHTGVFVEDYQYNATLAVTPGYTGKYNQRYGVTPDSGAQSIRFYVTTIDDGGNPMFPYAIGGGSDGTNTYAGEYYTLPQDSANNTLSQGFVDDTATVAMSSTENIASVEGDETDDNWLFGDNAPVENAWRYSEAYPFAVIEALFLSKPGRFATIFGGPTRLIAPTADPTILVDTTTRRTWDFLSTDDFDVHGDFDSNNNFITNIGYTQFIHSWIQFQGFNMVTDFTEKLRTVNSKLGYRFSGFVDKATMILSTDQFSNTGDATSLIIPQENIDVEVHTSPYKTRNFYSGVIVEKTATGFKVKGFDKNTTYFNILQSDVNGPRQSIERGGKSAKFIVWSVGTSYPQNTIVKVGNSFYQAPATVAGTDKFDSSSWTRLPSLPQVGAAKGVIYQKSTDVVLRVDYETEYETIQEVFDFAISLGRFQESQGYAFGEYDISINAVRNWAYAAEQLLFWATGSWEIGNTLELSPMAGNIRFQAPKGFVARILRTDRNQFTLLDQDGIAVSVTDCEVLREDTRVEIVPPTGTQIYGCLLHTIEIEHAMVLDNITDFNDTMYDSLLNQRQKRLRLKAKRANNWDGRFMAQGFTIEGDELTPNLDNMAASIGRYHELGYIPVEKDIYRSARGLFGFKDREYLRDLDVLDDDQFDFYKGMIQNKGTATSLSRIAKSSAVIQGNVAVFDEWALKVGEFGDVENDQAVELRLEKIDIIQDPQLVTLAFPEDTTGFVQKIDVLYNLHEYFSIPTIEISAPNATGTQATATASLDSQGRLSTITVTEGGLGYTELVGLTVIAGNTVVNNASAIVGEVSALSSALFDDSNIVAIANITIADHFAADTSPQLIDLTGVTETSSVVKAINLNAITNANVSAQAIPSYDANANLTSYVMQISGPDFSLAGAGLVNLNLVAARYQPQQRYAIEVANNTTSSNIIVNVDDVNVPYTGGTNWVFDSGDRWEITTSSTADANTEFNVSLNTGLVNGSSVFADENTVLVNNTQPYIDVYVNGVLILNPGYELRYNTPNNTTVRFGNISLLPQDALNPRINGISGQLEYVLLAGSNVFVVEHATIDFTDAYQGDLPGSTLQVKVGTNDGIAIKVGSKRIYDITPDIKNDEVILIDIDDTTRFLKKPTGAREHNLWPSTSAVDFKGITDADYRRVPNAGYVKPSAIDYQAFNVPSIPALFNEKRIYKPSEDDLVHIANSENLDWNVYKLKDTGANVSFVEQGAGIETSYLYSDTTLFSFVDSNQLQEDDLSRYLDYHLILKKGNLSDNLVVWTNEQVIDKKSARVKDFGAISMIQANVATAGPPADSIFPITNITPASAGSVSANASAASGSIVTVTKNGGTLANGDSVRFITTDFESYTFTANITHLDVGSVRISDANVDFVTLSRPIRLSFDGDTEDATDHMYYPTGLDKPSGNFTIVSSIVDFQNFFGNVANTDITNVTNSLANVTFTVIDQSNLHGQTHTVSNVNNSAGTFTINQANVTSTVDVANLTVELQQICKITSNAHGLYTSDVVKVFANTVGGFYMIEEATDDTFVINAPYHPSISTTGEFLTRGVEIVTSEDHALDTDYAGKRVMLHNADNPYYNQVYTVTSVTSANTIIARENFAYTTSANTIANSVMTTLDHDVITLNNTTIKIDNISSANGIEESINRTFTLRRGFITSDQMSIDFPMLRGIRDSYGGTRNQVIGSIPYVTNYTDEMLTNIVITGSININEATNTQAGFNSGSVTGSNAGSPHAGMGPTQPISPLTATAFNTALPGSGSTVTGTGQNASLNPQRGQINIPTVTPTRATGATPTDGNPVQNNNQTVVLNPSIIMTAPIAPCGPIAPAVCRTPLPPEPRRTETIPGICYGAATDIVGGITGNGASGREWLGEDSGYYQQISNFDRDVSRIGADHFNHGLKPHRGLAGAQTWSDNGGTNTFNMAVQFNTVGTYWIHVSGWMRRNYSATTYVDISGATTGNGRVNSRFSGQKYVKPILGNVKEITTTTPGQQVTFAASTTGGGNHWNAVIVEVSAQAGAVRSCSLPTTRNIANPGAPTPLQLPSNAEKRSIFYSDATSNAGDETFSIEVAAGGPCSIVFDHYAGAAGIEVFQGVTRGAETTFVAESTPGRVRNATGDEKGELMSHFNRSSQDRRNFVAGVAPSSRTSSSYIGTQYMGALDFVVDRTKGTFIKIIVRKEALEFAHMIKIPKLHNSVVANQDPTATIPCGTIQHQPGTGNPVPQPTGHQTPIITPAGSYVGQIYGEPVTDEFGRFGGFGRFGSGIHREAAYYGNYGGFSRPPMAGFNFIPDVFKKTVKVTQSTSYGVPRPLTSGRYVNNTVQRISGGYIVPLAAPVRTATPTGPLSIKTVDSSNYPHYNDFTLPSTQFMNNTSQSYIYSPDRIGSDIRLSDGTIIRGGTFGGSGSDIRLSDGTIIRGGTFGGFDFNDVTAFGGDTFLINDPTSGVPPIVGAGLPETTTMSPSETIPAADAPVDVDGTDFNDSQWVFTICPLDELGNEVGPCAPIYINRPRPGITIDLSDTNLDQGDTVVINGTSVTFNGTSTTQIINALQSCSNSAETGGNFEVQQTGTEAVRLSACGNVPLTIKEGCKGGLYKEVLDFHVVRGFDQGISETSNAIVLPSSPIAWNEGTRTITASASSYTRYDLEDVSQGTAPQTSLSTRGSILSNRTVSSTTGGKNYVVGDRLRVVGGVPITEATSNITALCVDNPGAGYTSVDNIVISIGDGTTPGRNAQVGTIVLDANNGIASVELLNVGDSYDSARPPVVRIVDIGAGSLTSTPWAANTSFSSGQIVAYQTGYFEAQHDLETGPTFDTNGFVEKNSIFSPIDATMRVEFDSLHVPARVAKFEVVAVDDNGTIGALKIIDRGIYKVFPSDLTQGIPLEYDGETLGGLASGLGRLDPSNPDSTLSSPGAYDPASGKFFDMNGDIAGGTGARVFLTAHEIPDCSQRGNAKNALGLPSVVSDTNIPEWLADIINTGLNGAGYGDDDISAEYVPINDLIGRTRIRSPGFAGVRISELTPGLLDKLGIPYGDFNVGSLCIQAIIETSEDDSNRAVATLNEISDDLGLGYSVDGPVEIIQLLCVDTVGVASGQDPNGGQDPNSGQDTNGQDPNGQDTNSIFGDANITFQTDLFQYELRSITGAPITSSKLSQEIQPLYFESQRYDTEANITPSSFANIWIDNYQSNGWAYLENGTIISQQSDLVDTKFIKNSILYDEVTGDKKYDLDIYDPFKGILPGFLDTEITFITENDPVVYNSARSSFGAKDIGKVWWDTSTIRYNWYEQGTNRERWLNWGSAFPGSTITLFEWVESKALPVDYTGTGQPKNLEDYVTVRKFDAVIEEYVSTYYFWVHNPTDLGAEAVNVLGRTMDTFTLAKNLSDPQGFGLNLINFINTDSFTLSNISRILNEDEDILQINFSRDLNPDGLKHTSWLLSRKGANSNIPEDLSEKLVDSLSAVNAIGDIVPDPLLSEIEAYGEKFRPRQSMFKNVKEARRLFTYSVNQYLLDLKLNTEFVDWDQNLPVEASRVYIETVNWYAVKRIDPVTKDVTRYDASYKPVYNVVNLSELNRLGAVPDGTVVQVKATPSDRYQLYIFDAQSSTFGLIAIELETIQLKSTLYTDDTNDTLSTEIRGIAEIRSIAEISLWNILFFDLLEHAFVEQKQLSWAFKTSYLFAEKDESDLIEINGFKPDNFEKVIKYMNEVKPYTSKIRGFKDGKTAETEVFGVNSLSDYDKPPYYDYATGTVRILNDFDINDWKLMGNLAAYNDYASVENKGGVPIRTGNISMTFDRTNWQLTEFGYNPETTTANASIANNISYLMVTDFSDIAAASNTRSIDRIFKGDTSIQTQFASEMETYLVSEGEVAGSGSNVTLTGNAVTLFNAIESGGLNKTLELAKINVGGGWKGETWDANLFTQYVEGTDPTTEFDDNFGYDTVSGWDTTSWDFDIQVINYEGTFDPSLVNFRRNGVIYSGADGWTFSHMLYGEERPEELALFEPLETLILTVETNRSAYQHPTNNAIIIYHEADGNIVSNVNANAVTVNHRMHQDLFGGTEYYRLTGDGSSNTTLTANLLSFQDTIQVANASLVPRPKPGAPGIIWVGTEMISYTLKSSNTLSGLERGLLGTTIQDWIITQSGEANVTIPVYPAGAEFKFKDQVVATGNVWLDTGATSLSDAANANITDIDSVMKFLHDL